jgi:2-polyprenyl-3-methyl-5-hydroxy-6-metoxy-1,4-benzoquinol methylase
MKSWARNSETVRRGRERRYRLFMDLCAVSPEHVILDVGAGRGTALERFNTINRIVTVDLGAPPPTEWMRHENVKACQANGTNLPFADGRFPVLFSNSVIEHIPKELQPVFAAEVRRVSARYFVQTPNKWFPIEPHYQLPLVQFLPENVLSALDRRISFGFRTKDRRAPVRLLSARGMRRLFPDAEIHREKVLGITKSLMAVRCPNPP